MSCASNTVSQPELQPAPPSPGICTRSRGEAASWHWTWPVGASVALPGLLHRWHLLQEHLRELGEEAVAAALWESVWIQGAGSDCAELIPTSSPRQENLALKGKTCFSLAEWVGSRTLAETRPLQLLSSQGARPRHDCKPEQSHPDQPPSISTKHT